MRVVWTDVDDWWKDHVVRMYGRKRLDLLLVGLLWMQLYMVNMGDVFAKQKMSFLEFETFVMDAARADPRFGPDHLLVTKMYTGVDSD